MGQFFELLYLNGPLEEIYMRAPEGFNYPSPFWHLWKGLYGLHQTGRQWYLEFPGPVAPTAKRLQPNLTTTSSNWTCSCSCCILNMSTAKNCSCATGFKPVATGRLVSLNLVEILIKTSPRTPKMAEKWASYDQNKVNPRPYPFTSTVSHPPPLPPFILHPCPSYLYPLTITLTLLYFILISLTPHRNPLYPLW